MKSASPAAEVCPECGHRSVIRGGRCVIPVRESDGEDVLEGLCGCRCVFPPAPETYDPELGNNLYGDDPFGDKAAADPEQKPRLVCPRHGVQLFPDREGYCKQQVSPPNHRGIKYCGLKCDPAPSADSDEPPARIWIALHDAEWHTFKHDKDAIPYARVPSVDPQEQESFQNRVQPWMMQCFGPEISRDVTERNHRFLEESLELVQALGCTQDEAHQLVDYTYGRPSGSATQEVGGVMVTLAALCLAQGFDMHVSGETELARIWTKIDTIRAKQAAKPKHSPLPEYVPAAPPHSLQQAAREAAEKWFERFERAFDILYDPADERPSLEKGKERLAAIITEALGGVAGPPDVLLRIIQKAAEMGCLYSRQVHCAERENNYSDWCVGCQAKYVLFNKEKV